MATLEEILKLVSTSRVSGPKKSVPPATGLFCCNFFIVTRPHPFSLIEV